MLFREILCKFLQSCVHGSSHHRILQVSGQFKRRVLSWAKQTAEKRGIIYYYIDKIIDVIRHYCAVVLFGVQKFFIIFVVRVSFRTKIYISIVLCTTTTTTCYNNVTPTSVFSTETDHSTTERIDGHCVNGSSTAGTEQYR